MFSAVGLLGKVGQHPRHLEVGEPFGAELEQLVGVDVPGGVDADPDAALARAKLPDDVQAALKALPPDFRAAVVLCDVVGLDYAEIAQALGIPALALFPYTDPKLRTEDAREAFNPDNLVCRATRAVKARGLDIDAADRPRSSAQAWVKSAPMMAELFADLPEAQLAVAAALVGAEPRVPVVRDGRELAPR